MSQPSFPTNEQLRVLFEASKADPRTEAMGDEGWFVMGAAMVENHARAALAAQPGAVGEWKRCIDKWGNVTAKAGDFVESEDLAFHILEVHQNGLCSVDPSKSRVIKNDTKMTRLAAAGALAVRASRLTFATPGAPTEAEAEAKPAPTDLTGWRFVRNSDGSIGIFAPPPEPGKTQRTSGIVTQRQLDTWELLGRLADAKPAQDAVDAERLPPMPENVLADIQQAHEYVSMWAKGKAYYAPVSAYDDMPGKRKATIKDVMKSAKFIAPRLMSASLAMRDYFAAIDVYANKKGGV